jgi:hypothetical protein
MTAMHRLSRWGLSLSCLVLYLVSWPDWAGPWLGVLAFASGVGAVILELYERRLRKADELVTLNIQP